MKVKGSYNPPPFELEKINDTAVLRFYENVEEVTEEKEGETPVTGWQFDRYTIKRLYDAALQGRVEQDVAAWLATARQEEYDTMASAVRTERNRLLSNTDRTQLADAPEDRETKNAYKAYRQALREIPEQDGFPYNINYPVINNKGL